MASRDLSPPPPKKLRNMMDDLFASKDGADVTLIVHGKELQGHKLVLSNRSPVFKAMLEGPMAPGDQKYEINDPAITADDFETFLKFLYTDGCNIQQSNFKVMLHLANFYDVPYLQSKCIGKVDCFLDEDNIFEYAELGLQYLQTCSLLQKCFDILVFGEWNPSLAYCNGDDGVSKWISPELVIKFIKQHPRNYRSSFKEDALFDKVHEWAKNYCIQQNQEATSENIQSLMVPIMPHFKPEKFSPATLAKIVKEFKFIPNNRFVECLSDHVLKAVDGHGNLTTASSGERGPRNFDLSEYEYVVYHRNFPRREKDKFLRRARDVVNLVDSSDDDDERSTTPEREIEGLTRYNTWKNSSGNSNLDRSFSNDSGPTTRARNESGTEGGIEQRKRGYAGYYLNKLLVNDQNE